MIHLWLLQYIPNQDMKLVATTDYGCQETSLRGLIMCDGDVERQLEEIVWPSVAGILVRDVPGNNPHIKRKRVDVDRQSGRCSMFSTTKMYVSYTIS